MGCGLGWVGLGCFLGFSSYLNLEILRWEVGWTREICFLGYGTWETFPEWSLVFLGWEVWSFRFVSPEPPIWLLDLDPVGRATRTGGLSWCLECGFCFENDDCRVSVCVCRLLCVRFLGSEMRLLHCWLQQVSCLKRYLGQAKKKVHEVGMKLLPGHWRL